MRAFKKMSASNFDTISHRNSSHKLRSKISMRCWLHDDRAQMMLHLTLLYFTHTHMELSHQHSLKSKTLNVEFTKIVYLIRN